VVLGPAAVMALPLVVLPLAAVTALAAAAGDLLQALILMMKSPFSLYHR